MQNPFMGETISVFPSEDISVTLTGYYASIALYVVIGIISFLSLFLLITTTFGGAVKRAKLYSSILFLLSIVLGIFTTYNDNLFSYYFETNPMSYIIIILLISINCFSVLWEELVDILSKLKPSK